MDTITIEMPSYIYKHMQLFVEDKAVSAFLKYCTISEMLHQIIST